MPGFNCRPENENRAAKLRSRSLLDTRARRQRPGSSDGTQCALASHRIVINALALAAQSMQSGAGYEPTSAVESGDS